MRPETLAVHTARKPDPHSGAVTPPLVMSTTFARDEQYKPLGASVYGRSENPNRIALEAQLAALEGGEMALAFSSGMAAVNAMYQSLSPGAHVVIPSDSYMGTRNLFDVHYERMGVNVSKVRAGDMQALAGAMRKETALVWVETPSNPELSITDIALASQLAHEVGAVCVVDSTFATPFCQKPLAYGADVVMHSTTKFFGGHGDVTGGALIFAKNGPLYDRLRSIQWLAGAVPSPFDCWLLQRSIPSMPWRMRGHIENAGKVARFLAAHKAVAKVNYPGLPSHPGHALASKQMCAFGGMLSFEPKGGFEAAHRVACGVRLFTRATSLGGYESLIEHRASIEGAASTAPPALLRLSIGLEHADDLVADLDAALKAEGS
jgi:cystathionine gamma-synthase